MKKIFYCLCAASAMLFTACSDEAVNAPVEGESLVTITTQLPADLGTRAFGDGTTATNLTYAVYEKDSQTPLIVSTDQVTFSGLTATVKLRLANGKSYDLVFWADAAGSPYTFDADAQTVNINYNGVTSNLEKLDAFFANEKNLQVNGTINKTIQLKRPFAQLNIGATDYVAAETAAFKTASSAVKVNHVANAINIRTGEATGNATITFADAPVPADTETFHVTGVDADYLAMNYLLVNDDKQLVDVEFTAKSTKGETITRSYANVPVQRNYRTNIYGNILTEDANFNIEIVPGFDEPDYVYDLDLVAKVASNEELSNAISDGKSVILLGEGTYTLPASARGKTLTFVGTGDASNTVIKAVKNGEGDYSLDGSTAVFENLSITVGDSNDNFHGFVRCNGTFKNCIINNQLTLYGNSTFEGCTFNVEGNAYNVWTWGAKKAIFNNCTFNSDGKSMLLYGGAGDSENPTTILTINNCTFNDKGTTAYGKTAIEIGNDYNATYELIVNNTNVNGFEQNSNGIPTGTTLWSNKNSMDKDHLSVTVDGTKVY